MWCVAARLVLFVPRRNGGNVPPTEDEEEQVAVGAVVAALSTSISGAFDFVDDANNEVPISGRSLAPSSLVPGPLLPVFLVPELLALVLLLLFLSAILSPQTGSKFFNFHGSI